MVVIGAGTNLGDRAHRLRRAVSLLSLGPDPVLRDVRVSRVYGSPALLPEGAPRSWDLPFLNLAVSGRTALAPRELLAELKAIEARMGRAPSERWAPRAIDLDILAWEGVALDEPGLSIPHPGLTARPFALLPLVDLAPALEVGGKPAAAWAEALGEASARPDDRATRGVVSPRVMGIVNVTPDSFSDGGSSLDPARAVAHALRLADEGAAVVDLGAESTRPGAREVSAEEEWKRLAPVLHDLVPALRASRPETDLSVDTRHAATAERAIEAGVAWINDVSGLGDPRMVAIARSSRARFVFMHSLTVPADRDVVLADGCDPVAEVLEWGRRRLAELEDAGIDRDRLVFDPGVGFGKNATHSLSLLRDARRFLSLPVPVLYGHSRKSCFNGLTPRPFAERDPETLAASIHLAREGADYVRVHDAAGHVRAFDVLGTLGN